MTKKKVYHVTDKKVCHVTDKKVCHVAGKKVCHDVKVINEKYDNFIM